MKISATRLKQIIKEELFYREFHREGQELQEAEKAKDERISRKIAYLVDKEGKSRDQAVAIAHSMEERGDLEESEEAYRVVDAEKERKWREKWIQSIPPEDRKIPGVEYPEEDPTLQTIRPGSPASFKPARKHKK
tara:strand:+ start:2950 stop:3354 length:405 start_codon:yes stop_codon:yes gene_type:complete